MHSVKDPTEDEFLGAPPTVSLEEFLEGDSFIPMGLICSRLGQHGVDGMEEVLT